MEAVFFEVLNRSISALWLILAILLLRPLLRRAPKWIFCLLWGLVAIRLLLPFSIESALSLVPSSETVSPEIVMAQTPTIHTGVSFINSAVNPILSESFAPNPVASANPLQILFFIYTCVWLLGMACMLLYALVSWFFLRYRVAASLQFDARIRICDHISAPFILGIIRPKIYLPSSLDLKDRQHVIAHENAHLKRKDHWWKPIGFILLAVNWFNPLMWVAYVLLCRDIEAACDERVVKDMDLSDRKSYSEALLDCSISRRSIALCPLAFGEVSVKSRIKKVLHYKKPTIWIIVLSVIACIIAAVCFLTDPKDAPAAELATPFGKEYIVSQIVYESPNYSFSYTAETAPRYRLTEDMQIEILEDPGTDNWLTPGTFEPHDLTADDFASALFSAASPLSPTSLVKNNSAAWKLDVTASDNGTFYYLLQQKDGTLYYCLGYHRVGSDTIRWIFELVEAPGHIEPDTNEEAVSIVPEEAALSEEERLEAAIHDAIIEHNRHSSPNYSEDVFVCENHIIFDTMTLVACGTDDRSSYEETTVYMMVLYQEYDLSSGVIRDVGGSHMPVALTFDNDYTLLEYWTPEDGSYYLPSIEEKFPESCLELATDTQRYILAQVQSCYDQAIQYAELDTDQILENLYTQIEQSSEKSSNPEDYINEHHIAYREITYYGMYALEHAFKAFLKGEQTGLRGHLMALTCQDILKNMGEPFKSGQYSTGQEWFEQFKIYALSLKQQITTPYSSQYRPAIRLLLDMM